TGLARAEKPLNVARHLINLQVHAYPGLQSSQGRDFLSVRNEVDAKSRAFNLVDRETHTVDRHRTLASDVLRKVIGHTDSYPSRACIGGDRRNLRDSVDMPRHKVPAKRVTSLQGWLQVHVRPNTEIAESRQ